eukprot:3895855-Rhodomonas_salina.1
MRHLSADLRGRVALLTGARVKIGFEIGLKLLRAGATLIATTRFPADAAARYAAMPDFEDWRGRLQLHAVDLRDVGALEGFCDFLCSTLPRLDIVVNNACQTVRRPASYYAHLLEKEASMEAAVRQLKADGAALRLTALEEPSGTAAQPSASGQAALEARVRAEQTAGGANAELLPLFAQQASRAQWSDASSAVALLGEGDAGVAPARTHALLGGAAALSPAQLSQL